MTAKVGSVLMGKALKTLTFGAVGFIVPQNYRLGKRDKRSLDSLI